MIQNQGQEAGIDQRNNKAVNVKQIPMTYLQTVEWRNFAINLSYLNNPKPESNTEMLGRVIFC